MGRPNIPEVLPLIRAYYTKPENAVGGSLHIVLEDGNVSDGNVESCLEYAREHNDRDGEALAGLLLQMSKTQRRKLYRMSHYPPQGDDRE